ncbi:MAG: guanylate kinase, partial [Proteobacteria bacterium]|nr:guanylate kinase [Pseudomonadota bacterium]
RAEDTPEVIERRLENARTEIGHWQDYDFVVINNDLEVAFDQVHAILIAERLRRGRRPGLEKFVGQLTG